MFKKEIGLLAILLSSLALAKINAAVPPGGVATFSNPSAANPTVSFNAAGTWTLQDCVSDGAKTTCAQTTVIVNPSSIDPKLKVGNASGIAGNSVTVSVSLDTGTLNLSGVNFDLHYPFVISTNTVSAGTAAVAAGKGVNSSLIAGDLRVIVSGLNQNVIGSGPVAVITLQLPPGQLSGAVSSSLINVAGVDPAGMAVPMGPSINGVITVTANKAPVVTASPGQTITLPASATVSATATDDGAPNPPGALTHSWSAI